MLILWLLSESPQHGYQIKRVLDEASLKFWFPVEAGSIYGGLSTMAKAGYIEALAVERAGLRPERTRFKITPEGRKHLQDLVRRAWTELPRVSDPIQMALAATSELDETEFVTLFAERKRLLLERLEEIRQKVSSAPAREMASRLMHLTLAELEWLGSLEEDSKSQVRGG